MFVQNHKKQNIIAFNRRKRQSKNNKIIDRSKISVLKKKCFKLKNLNRIFVKV